MKTDMGSKPEKWCWCYRKELYPNSSENRVTLNKWVTAALCTQLLFLCIIDVISKCSRGKIWLRLYSQKLAFLERQWGLWCISSLKNMSEPNNPPCATCPWLNVSWLYISQQWDDWWITYSDWWLEWWCYRGTSFFYGSPQLWFLWLRH